MCGGSLNAPQRGAGPLPCFMSLPNPFFSPDDSDYDEFPEERLGVPASVMTKKVGSGADGVDCGSEEGQWAYPDAF